MSHAPTGRYSPLALRAQQVFLDPCQWREEKKTHTGTHFGSVSLPLFRLFTYTAVERTQNKNLAQYFQPNGPQ
jgi:hypothetical protein